ncbi:YqhR family membrane protein [Pseudalkalibacillus hwajinpoensis]|uniref:YqhR family membrane protein n=1 Tax=Guptibacillus hwajinpoensis TaxID=208199 RepID=UPI00325BE750
MEKKDQNHDQELEQNKQEQPLSFASKVVTIGIAGGLFWGLIGYLTYLFKFTKVPPSLILSPWALGEWKNQHLGQWIGILAIGLISILVAFLYKVTLVKINNMLAGLVYGAVLWLIVFYLLNPMFSDLPSLMKLDKNTVITTICLYLLYGVFIGYSISFEYHENQQARVSYSNK